MTMKEMMRSTTMTLLGVLFLGSVALAQEKSPLDDLAPAHKEMVEEIGSTAVTWWNPRLNKYKRTIDQVLSGEDLETLNRMRVRFAILLERVGPKIGKEFSTDENDAEVEVDDGVMVFELMEIWTGTLEIAIRYEEELESLNGKVFADVVGFADEMAVAVETYSEEHRAELEADEKGGEFMASREEVTSTLRSVEGMEEEFSTVYGFVVEPLIMLFNGGDLRDMFPGVMGESSSVGAGGLIDLLPASNVMMQNYPNPANESTTIPLDLERSANASIRVFNAEGRLMKTEELGTLPSGAQEVELVTEDLEEGSYLYQLVLASPAGDEIFAKVMQVVR